MKKFEEGVFSDLRNLKPGVDASLEEPKVSPALASAQISLDLHFPFSFSDPGQFYSRLSSTFFSNTKLSALRKSRKFFTGFPCLMTGSFSTPSSVTLNERKWVLSPPPSLLASPHTASPMIRRGVCTSNFVNLAKRKKEKMTQMARRRQRKVIVQWRMMNARKTAKEFLAH